MFDLSALELSSAIKEKKISVIDAVSSYIALAKENKYNAFISVCEEEALVRAQHVQAQIDRGEAPSPLAGVPIAIKDNISTKGLPTTCASKTLENYRPVFNATVIEKIEQAGLIIVGKTNLDEFAMGGSSETGYFGPVKNPADTARVAGGSSGGNAAAVAGGEALLSLGSDTGGSIRQPCSFCGITGMKPTYGAVSRYGLVAYASSLDQIGVMGRNVADCAALLEIIWGADERDSTCVVKSPLERKKIANPRIGVPRNYFAAGIDADVKARVLAAADDLAAAGASITEFDMPLMEYMVPAYYIIACAEASSNLACFDGFEYGHRSAAAETLSDVFRLSRNEGFGLEVKRRIMLGSFVLSSGYYDAYYKKALQVRALIKDAYNRLFADYDMILSPIAPTTAFKIGENIDDPLKMYMGDIYTVSVNLAGLPSIALPCGTDGGGLPVGFQLIGDSFSDGALLEVAGMYQERTRFHL
ncbi:MAG: Asp-tRNA(Asn)/Glu-tRNA(Gln) amidotransferase subunit GatA [Lachnospiraceae bacterium]|jgi:aspartyl-tRNA(Asn)/glutamyl-tRNA(Gln) amidotransferase subunit A|nr:Asp-tRNA(Asn)/Glu-tRNA(Gln) amidotransferase subunit GatA [Lachnospiraceae bacterium]